MAFSFAEMKDAVETYPASIVGTTNGPQTAVELEIVDVDVPGALNVGDTANFRVKVTNHGVLDITDVTVRIKGLNGATVKQNGAAAPFVSEFVTETSQLGTVDAHGGSLTTNGSPFSFTAPGSPRSSRNLVQVTLEGWNASLGHILNSHSDPLPAGPPIGTFAAETFPR